jgi:hypothetical protein
MSSNSGTNAVNTSIILDFNSDFDFYWQIARQRAGSQCVYRLKEREYLKVESTGVEFECDDYCIPKKLRDEIEKSRSSPQYSPKTRMSTILSTILPTILSAVFLL